MGQTMNKCMKLMMSKEDPLEFTNIGEVSQEEEFWKPERDVVYVADRVNEIIKREPNSIRGFEFVAENCKECFIYVYDHLSQVTIENCENCYIFLGPCEGSVFLRNCKSCTICSITRQLRTRDCYGCNLWLVCHTQSVIEESFEMKFGCLSWNYSGLEQQIAKAKLSPWCNQWSSPHTFGEGTWKINADMTSLDYFKDHCAQHIDPEGCLLDTIAKENVSFKDAVIVLTKNEPDAREITQHTELKLQQSYYGMNTGCPQILLLFSVIDAVERIPFEHWNTEEEISKKIEDLEKLKVV